MARFYSNENFPKRVVAALRGLGHDVLTALEADNANKGIEDPDVLAFAIAQQRAVITINRKDFVRLHQLTGTHFGIVVCSEDDDDEGQAKRIHEAISDLDSLIDQLIRVNRPSLGNKRG